jgi:4-amino-4-deoxy-L-arabinose transferase-like glycosyltransferase
VGLLVRLLYLATAAGPAFSDPLIDGDMNDALATGIAAGEGFPPGVFWQPPLYPLLVGMIYRVAGPGLLGPRLAQAAAGALTAGLVAAVGRRLLGPRWGLVAGLLVALAGPLVFYVGELLPTTLGVLAVALSLWVATGRLPAATRALAAGAVVGVGSLALPAIAPLCLAAGWLAARGRPLIGGLAVAATAAMLAPVCWANHARSGEWALVSANAGINLWLGNHPDGDRALAIRPGAAWEALLDEPASAGVETLAGADAYFAHKALAGCLREPIRCATGSGQKARLLVLARELPRNEDLSVLRHQSPVLAWLTPRLGSFELPFGLLLPLAAAGIAALRGRRLRGMALAAGLLALVPIVFFVCGRYRAPLVPPLAILGALGAREIGRRSARSVAAAVGVLVVAVIPVHVATDEVDFVAELHYVVGGRRARLGDDAGAAESWQRALAERPSYLEAAFNLGLALERLGRPAEAARAYERLLRDHPDHEGARARLTALQIR